MRPFLRQLAQSPSIGVSTDSEPPRPQAAADLMQPPVDPVALMTLLRQVGQFREWRAGCLVLRDGHRPRSFP